MENGKVMILYTSDIHCGVDQGFGLAGLHEIRKRLKAQGYATILVDDGDAIQGEMLGLLTEGEDIAGLMNDIGYDVAIPGNHEFDYGMKRFFEIVKRTAFPYISCNFTYKGELVFAPYAMLEACGIKIAFVGIATPETIVSSTPSHFQDEQGNLVYGFMQDKTGEKLYAAVQKAVDDARAAGADYVYAMAHLGNSEWSKPYTYADVISHTSGIDVFLDGHSHDTDQVVMKNKDGKDVLRSAVGTKLNCIGHSLISPEKGIESTAIWSWPNGDALPALLGIRNEIADKIDAAMDGLEKAKNERRGYSAVHLNIYDPVEKDESGNRVRIVRLTETNLGDFSADAFRMVAGADIGLVNSGGIRADIGKGVVTYGDLINVYPFGNKMSVLRATGQEVLDALEWGVRAIPDESGAFFQVSGISFDVDAGVESPCMVDENSMFAGIAGERRVKNVMVGDEPIDPGKTYTVAGIDYSLVSKGDGQTAFAKAHIVESGGKADIEVLAEYLGGYLGGTIGEEYADPYGQGRIRILNG
ncbi:MAG: bifunctional UDP-sugar hydrolase/5'-nucleotidase [Lachnospiraceae bacterium]|nr:bifunctional UDP-sugar hydrolase/5'-nucleotidase [Lachnospiraceae bacterium]